MAQKYSIKRADHWEIGFWLVFNADGSVRMTRSEPTCYGMERAMAMTAKIPHSLFRVPQLRGTIELNHDNAPPVEIDVSAAATALTEALGARVELTIEEQS
jgi:hypothetical protein